MQSAAEAGAGASANVHRGPGRAGTQGDRKPRHRGGGRRSRQNSAHAPAMQPASLVAPVSGGGSSGSSSSASSPQAQQAPSPSRGLQHMGGQHAQSSPADGESAILLEVASLLTTDAPMDEVVPAAVVALRRMTGADHASLWDVVPSGGRLFCRSSTMPAVVGTSVPLGGVVGFAVRTKQGVRTSSVAQDWRHSPDSDRRGDQVPSSVLAVPVKVADGMVLGVLECVLFGGAASGSFGPQAETVTNFLAGMLSMALARQTLSDEVSAKARHAEALHQITSMTSTDVNTHTLIRRVLRATTSVVRADLLVYYEVHAAPFRQSGTHSAAHPGTAAVVTAEAAAAAAGAGSGFRESAAAAHTSFQSDRDDNSEAVDSALFPGLGSSSNGTAASDPIDEDGEDQVARSTSSSGGTAFSGRAALSGSKGGEPDPEARAALEQLSPPSGRRAKRVTQLPADSSAAAAAAATDNGPPPAQADQPPPESGGRVGERAGDRTTLGFGIGTGQGQGETSGGSQQPQPRRRAAGHAAPPGGRSLGSRARLSFGSGAWRLRSVLGTMVAHSLDGRVPEMRLPLGAGIASEVALSGRAVRLDDVKTHWEYDSDPICQQLEYSTGALMAVPVSDASGRSVAVIEARVSAGGRVFTAADLDLLTGLAAATASVLRQIALVEQAVRAKVQAAALHRITDLISAEIGTDNVVPRIIDSAYQLVDAERITFFLVEKRPEAGSGPLAAAPPGERKKGVISSESDGDDDDGDDDQNNSDTKVAGGTGATRDAAAAAGAGVGGRRSGGGGGRGGRGPRGSAESEDLSAGGGLSASALRQRRSEHRAASLSAIPKTGAELQLAEERRRSLKPRDISKSLSQNSLLRGGSGAGLLGGAGAGGVGGKSGRGLLHATDQAHFHDRDLVCKVSKDSAFEGTRIEWGSGIVGAVAMSGRLLNIPDAYLDQRFDPASDERTNFRTRALLTVPVTTEDAQVVAVVQAVNRRDGGAFDANDEANLLSLANSAGIILRKNALYHAVGVAQRKSQALLDLLRVSLRSTTLTDMIDGVACVASDILSASQVNIFFVQHGRVFPAGSKDSVGRSVPSFAVGQGLVGRVAQTGEPVRLASARSDPAFDRAVDERGGHYTVSVLILPVVDGDGTVLAVIQAVNKCPPGMRVGDAAGAPAAAALSRGSAPLTVPGDVYAAAGVADGAASVSVSVPAFSRRQSSRPGGLSPPGAAVPHALSSSSRRTSAPLQHEFRVPALSPDLALRTFVPFSPDDADIMEAFCTQVRGTVRLFRHDALRERVNDDSSFQSMMNVYLRRAPSSADEESSSVAGSVLMDWRTPPEASASAVGVARRHADRAVSAAAAAVLAAGVVPMHTPGSPSASHPSSPRALGPSAAERWAALALDDRVGGRLGELRDLNFDVFRYDANELLGFAYHIFDDLGLVSKFGIEPGVLRAFLMAVRHGYRDNPFHNWHHGFSVFHFAAWMVRTARLEGTLTDDDVLALLLASLCHDIDHPGNTNTFEINRESDLALVHNDHSVLENHHAHFTFLLLREPGCNVLAGLPRARKFALRTAVIEAVLATDMTAHFESCRKLGSREPEDPFDREDPRDRQDLVNACIHSADLSGQTFPGHVAREWEDRISEEFKRQARAETEMGMPVALFMQDLNVATQRAKLQVNFIDFVLTPWWENIARLLPEMGMCRANLLANRAHYERIATAPAPSPTGKSAAAPDAPPAGNS